MNLHNRTWYPMVRGIVAAAAWLQRWHGEDTIVEEMLTHMGIDKALARKAHCDDYDMGILKDRWPKISSKKV